MGIIYLVKNKMTKSFKILKALLFQKQNKKSVVEFYLVDTFEIYHYLPIYNAIKKEGINCSIVAEPQQINTAGSWFDYKTAIRILKRNAIKYTTKCNPNALIAITTQFARNVSKYRNYKAELSYGVATLQETAFQLKEEVSREFDFQFVHGCLCKNIIDNLKYHANSIIIGYPKYVDFFKSRPRKDNILLELNIKTRKPFLLYLPTWDEWSSITNYAETINSLREKFFVIAKPHHCTQRLKEKEDEMNLLRSCSDFLLDANYSLAKTSILADVIIVDGKSGATTEISYLVPETPMLIIRGIQKDEEYIIEQEKLGQICYNVEELQNKLQNLSLSEKWLSIKNNYIKELFSVTPEEGIDKIICLVKDLMKQEKMRI